MKARKQSRLTGALALMVAQAVVLLFGYLTHLWIGRVLGPESYGVYGVVLSVQTVLGVFLTLGVPSAVSRFVARDEKHARGILRQALRIQFTIAIGLAITAALFAPIIARLLQDTTLTPLIAFTAAVVFFQAFYPIYVQFFSGLHRFNKQASLTIFYAFAKLAGAISLMYVFSVFGALSGFAIGGFLAAILGWWWTKRLPKDEMKPLPLRSFLSFAGMYVITLAGLQVLMSLDLFMVKSFLHDDAQAGYYNAAVTLSRISYFLLQGISFIILPSVSTLTRPGASHEDAIAFIQKVIRYLIILIVPSITLAAATSKELIILFFSRDYIAGAAPLTLLMVALGALAFFLLLANIAAGAGKAKVALGITLGMIAISGVLGFILVPRFGLLGAALQTTVASFIGLLTLGTYIFWVFKIPFPTRSSINVAVATAAMILPTYIWKASSLVLPLQYIILLAGYVGLLFILREISAADRTQLAQLHPKLAFLAPRKL